MSKLDLIKKTINETALLNRYLKSRGINPEFVSKDQKVAHSKTNQFKVWMNAHINDPIKESVDKKDTITFDIPLLIRVLEFAREDLKSDVNLHKMVERLISMRGKGTLTMNQYGQIIKEEKLDELSPELQHRYFKAAYAQDRDKTVPKDVRKKRRTGMNKVINRTLRRNTISTPGAEQDFKDQEAKRGIGHVRDHVETDGQQLDEISKEKANEYMWSAKSDRQRTDDQINKEIEKQGSGWSNRRHNKITKLLNRNTKRTDGINRALDRLNKEETEVQEGVVDAVKKAWKAVSNFDDPTPKYDGNTKRRQALKDKLAAKKKQKEVSEAKEANYGGDYQASVMRFKEKAAKKPVDMTSLAARMQAAYKKEDDKKKVKESLEPMAACNCPSDGANTPDDVAPSKAKKIKLLLGGKKSVTEEMYDHEKEDKPVTSPGKKVKFEKPGVDTQTKETPQAAAVLSGGKTLTGEPRDTIEIDPMMKMKQSSPNSQKTV